MKKIKMCLKVAILIAFITLIFSCMINIAYGSTSKSTIGKSGGYLYIQNTECTTFNLSRLLLRYDDIFDLTESELDSLLNAKIKLGRGSYKIDGTSYSKRSNLHNRNVMCIAHYATTTSSENNWYLRQILSFYYTDTGSTNSTNSYTLVNYYGTNNTQIITKASGTNKFNVACRLGKALYNMYTNGSDDLNTTTQKNAVGQLLTLAKNNSYLSFNSVFNSSNWGNYSSASIDTSNSYYTKMNSYKSVTATWGSSSTKYTTSRK